jgi:hypothetical protein
VRCRTTGRPFYSDSRASGYCRSTWCDLESRASNVWWRPSASVRTGDLSQARHAADDNTPRRAGCAQSAQQGGRRCPWLQREATALTPRALLDEIEKLTYLRALGADAWHLNSLTPNRPKLLAGIGRRSTKQALQRMSPERRFPILVALLAQAAEDVTVRSSTCSIGLSATRMVLTMRNGLFRDSGEAGPLCRSALRPAIGSSGSADYTASE